jgi:hypothetical protein
LSCISTVRFSRSALIALARSTVLADSVTLNGLNFWLNSLSTKYEVPLAGELGALAVLGRAAGPTQASMVCQAGGVGGLGLALALPHLGGVVVALDVLVGVGRVAAVGLAPAVGGRDEVGRSSPDL